MQASELLRRYKNQELDFTGINLAKTNLNSAKLKQINLTQALFTPL